MIHSYAAELLIEWIPSHIIVADVVNRELTLIIDNILRTPEKQGIPYVGFIISIDILSDRLLLIDFFVMMPVECLERYGHFEMLDKTSLSSPLGIHLTSF